MQVFIELKGGSVQVACVEDGVVERYYRIAADAVTGNIYRGKVESVSSAGAFVDIGRAKHGFLTGRTALVPGSYVTVQAEREEDAVKGALLTEKLTIAGKYTVVTTDAGCHFSHKLPESLKKVLAERYAGQGVVFRTNCVYATDEEIKNEINENIMKLAGLFRRSQNLYKVGLLYKADPLQAAKNLSPDGNIIYTFGAIREQIDALYSRQVEHKGVELVFDRTEAMTVVDVNSHRQKDKYTDFESMALAVNLIAVELLGRHLRLRNLGGIIAVDFISMKNPDSIAKIKRALDACLAKDDVTARAEFVDSLCVALITRRKRYSSI